MVDLIPGSSDEHLSVVRATAPKFFKGASDLTFRERIWLAYLQRYGRIEYNATSFACVWDVEYSQPEVRQYGDSGDLEFNQHDALKQLTVNVRGYSATDRFTEMQRLMNRGQTAIVNEYKRKSERLVDRIKEVICAELYTDGYAANNGRRFIGMESFMGYDTCAVTDKIATNNDTYGGLDTDLQAHGGTWSSNLGSGEFPNATLAKDYPYGTGTSEYDFLSSLLVNTNSTRWSSGEAGWKNNCEDVMRFSKITQTRRGAGRKNRRAPYLHMLSSELYEQAQTYFAAKYRGLIPHKESEDLGFAEAMQFEGAAMVHEFDTPAGVGYGVPTSMMDMFIMTPQLYGFWGPEKAIEKLAYLYLTYVFGNLKFQPKFFSKYADFTS